MNQILINQRFYVTPEVKKKKRMYKFYFILSVFLVLILGTIYIYGEYDRNKSEQVSKQILEDMNGEQEERENTKKSSQSDVLVVVLNDAQEDAKVRALSSKQNETPKKQKYTTDDGYSYYTIATVSIPKININYPVIQGVTESEKETEELLKLSPCKLEGPEPNEVGNFCIVGHNYRNTKFFSKVPTLLVGDEINITDLTGKTTKYEVYYKYIVVPEDVSCLEQKTQKKEVTLITCTDDSKQRVVVKAREVQ